MKTSQPLSWAKPLRDYGDGLSRTAPGILGTHRGPTSCLNVVNAQPGFLYYHCRSGSHDVRRFELSGWRVVQKGRDPEYLDSGQFFGHDQGSNNSGAVSATPELILMKISEDDYRPIAEAKEAANKAALHAADEQYLDRGASLTEQIGAGGDRGPVYYRDRGHGYS